MDKVPIVRNNNLVTLVEAGNDLNIRTVGHSELDGLLLCHAIGNHIGGGVVAAGKIGTPGQDQSILNGSGYDFAGD